MPLKTIAIKLMKSQEWKVLIFSQSQRLISYLVNFYFSSFFWLTLRSYFGKFGAPDNGLKCQHVINSILEKLEGSQQFCKFY